MKTRERFSKTKLCSLFFRSELVEKIVIKDWFFRKWWHDECRVEKSFWVIHGAPTYDGVVVLEVGKLIFFYVFVDDFLDAELVVRLPAHLN